MPMNLGEINSSFSSNMNSIGQQIASLSTLSDPSEDDVQNLVDDNKRWSLLVNLRANCHKTFFDGLNSIVSTMR